MPFPYIYTFYSYKGGVGRSLALLNVAYTLAGRGRHVLMIDMDLEAPGISGFLRRHDEVEIPQSPREPGVLTLLEAAIQNLPGTDEGLSEATAALPPLRDLLWSVRAERLEALKPKLGLLGRLDVLGAELSEGYFQRLENLGLKNLDYDGIVRLSKLLRKYLKSHRFPHRPLGVEDFEEPIQTPYDYILIDSRTGVTEIGGLCVGPMADRLVVLTGLNDQNLEGTATLLKEIGVELRPRQVGDPAWDEADQVTANDDTASTLGPKPTILVATPVPPGETELKRTRLLALVKRFGIQPSSLSYFPRLSLMETLIVRDYREEHLTREYEDLATHVMAKIGDDALSIARRADRFGVEDSDLETAAHAAARLAPIDPAMAEYSLTRIGNQATKASDYLTLRTVSAYLASLPSQCVDALYNWGNALAQQAEHTTSLEADRYFELAYKKYEEALRRKPAKTEILYNWGSALMLHGQRTLASEKRQSLFHAARTRLLLAQQAQPGSLPGSLGFNLAALSAYNLARLNALLENASEALHWLEIARISESKPLSLTRSKLCSDPAFAPIGHHPNYLQFILKLPVD